MSLPVIPEAHRMAAWQQNQTRLAELTNWQVEGKIGIRTFQDAISAKINWRVQNKNNFQLELTGPLGQGYTQLLGKTGEVILKTSNGEVFTAPDAETLLLQTTKWKVPVHNLYYWVRGLPTPVLPIERNILNQYGFLSSLRQGEWLILYENYQPLKHHSQIVTPRKIQLHSSNLTVKLIIQDWGQ